MRRQADVEQTQDRSSVSPPTLTAKTKPALGRKPLPDHLPSETITHPPVCSCPNCGGTVFSKIGTDEREVLEYVPSHFKRVVHLRPKMSCRACETIVQAPMPSLPIERGRPGPNLLAHVLVSKYCDHLPLHRQSDIFAREGIDLDRSTLAGWVGAMAALLKILSDRIGAHVRAGETVHADDTPVPVLIPDAARPKPAASGPSYETSGRGDQPYRPLLSMPTLRIARENVLINCYRTVAAFCMQTPMLASTSSMKAMSSPARHASRR